MEVEDATAHQWVEVWGELVVGASEDGVEVDADDEREGDSMEFDDEAAGSGMVVDVERTPDSERVWRGGRTSARMNANL
ncbi:hypothetical protein PQX77_015220 [Marasmius sp. AFHP31]|nr:hypothetical protein PQX77_015220 [Marasmius sp. AFHP31]